MLDDLIKRVSVGLGRAGSPPVGNLLDRVVRGGSNCSFRLYRLPARPRLTPNDEPQITGIKLHRCGAITRNAPTATSGPPS